MKQNKGYHIEVRKPNLPKILHKKILKLNLRFLKSQEKVAYYYEDINTGLSFSFNKDVTFYAASTIKILAILYLFDKKVDLSQEITIEEKDIKQGSGIIKNEMVPKTFSLKKLMELILTESDNTAYLKLVDFIGIEKLQKYGKSLNALHPLEGKDLFGITSCQDMRFYFQKLFELSKDYPELELWTKNPSYHIIDSRSLHHLPFLKKYGHYDIAYHECGIVLDENPFYLMILTQKGQKKHAKKFINQTAKEICQIHQILKKEELKKCQK